MTIIQLETTSKEFKQGFRAAMKMIIMLCDDDSLTIKEIKFALKGGLRIDDLMNESENKE